MIDPAAVDYEVPRPLAPQGVANLHAFARLYGYVRFFHPSDQAAAASWDDVAICGVRAIEDAKNAQELSVALQGIFLPLAPTLQIGAAGRPGRRFPRHSSLRHRPTS
jgi:hypothetical protein